MSKVKALGYVGCAVSDFDAWDQLLGPIFGMELRVDTGADLRQYRMDSHHHRLSLHKAKGEKLQYVGWDCGTREELDALAGSLRSKGVALEHAAPELCAQRSVMDMYSCTAPDGIRTELFFGLAQDHRHFCPRRGIEGFNTGELGMGHVVLASGNRESAAQWYREMLGFRLSDHIFWDGIEATFLHCNPRHHSIALTNELPGLGAGELGHFMLEVKSLDDVGQAYDLALEKGWPLALTLGRHTNDLTTSFYVYSPSGWWIEYGYGGREIDDDTWTPAVYQSPKIWGHQMLPPPEGKIKKL